MAEINALTSESCQRKGSAEGLLAGQQFVLKDLVAIAGHISSFGHARWRSTHAPAEANAFFLDALLSGWVEIVNT